MTKQLLEGSTNNSYVYGADGQLVNKNSTVYIGGVYENAAGTITKYYYAGGERVAMRTGSTVYFLTTDQLGGTGLVTNSSGNMVSRIRYYPYGGIRTQDGSAPPTDKLFTGQQRETPQVYDYNARLYNTDIGRMPQADNIVTSATDPQAQNRYSYTDNNPATYIDPTGHVACCAGGIPSGQSFAGLIQNGYAKVQLEESVPPGQELAWLEVWIDWWFWSNNTAYHPSVHADSGTRLWGQRFGWATVGKPTVTISSDNFHITVSQAYTSDFCFACGLRLDFFLNRYNAAILLFDHMYSTAFRPKRVTTDKGYHWVFCARACSFGDTDMQVIDW